MNITLLKTSYVKLNDKKQGCKLDFSYIIENNSKWTKDKQKMSSVQNTNAGYRLGSDDKDYFNHWEGLIFVDLDHVSNIDYEFDKVNKTLSKLPIFYCSQKSASNKGIHLFFYIKSKQHTIEEYYNYVAVCLNEVYKIKSLRNYIDTHNIQHQQLIKISQNKFYVNEHFDENLSEEFIDFYNEEINKEIKNAVRQVYDNKTKVNEDDCIKYDFIKSESPDEIKLINKPNIVWGHNERFILFNTLCYFFSESDAKRLCYEISILNKKSDTGNDKIQKQISLYKFDKKYGCNKKYCNELVDVYGFDIYTKPIEKDVNNIIEIELKEDGYFSDVLDEFLNNLGQITLLECMPGRGKTNGMKLLNNIIITQPYTSIIENKFNNTDFEQIYDYFQLEKPCNKIVCTPDKLINFSDDLISNIEYVVIDESHTIFTNSKFRLHTMAKLIERVKDLANMGKKIILMTGTPFREYDLFKDYDFKYIRIKTNPKHKRNIKIKYVANNKVKRKKIIEDIKRYCNDGYKVIFPYNRGDGGYDDFISTLNNMNIIIKSSYFKKSNKDEDLNKEIIENGNIDDCDLLFCSLYMGEGLDINYEGKVIILFDGIETGQYISQIAARFRNTDVECNMYLNRRYNISKSYTEILEKNKIDNNIIDEIINVLNNHKDDNKYNQIITAYINRYPFIDKLKTDVNKDNLILYEISESCFEYYKQLSVLIDLLKSYGFDVKFYKTDEDEKGANEIFKLIKGSKKYRLFKEYEKCIDLLNNITEVELLDIKISYKTKDNMLKFIKELYSKGVKFDDCIKIGMSLCVDEKVRWNEMDNIKRYVEYMFEDKVNNRISNYYKEFVNDLNKLNKTTITYYDWKKKITDWNNKICANENINITKDEMKSVIEDIIKIHLFTHIVKNSISFEVRNYGKILDEYFFIN